MLSQTSVVQNIVKIPIYGGYKHSEVTVSHFHQFSVFFFYIIQHFSFARSQFAYLH